MIETLKSILFVVVTVMVALIIQAQAANLNPDTGANSDDAQMEQIQVYN